MKLWRWIIRLLLILGVSFFEKAMGLPIVTILLTSLYANRLDRKWHWGLLAGSAVMLSVLLMIKLSLSWLVISASYLIVRYAQKILSSRLSRLVMSSFLGSLILAIVGFGDVDAGQIIYGLAAILICILWLKRSRFHLR